MIFKLFNLKKGFTLLEMLIVIAIIGALIPLSITGYNNGLINSRNTRRKADLRLIEKALALYYADNNGIYPETIGNQWWGTCVGHGEFSVEGANGYIPNLAPRYLQKLPRDPRENINTNNGTGGNDLGGCSANNPSDYACYAYWSNGVDFKVVADCTPEGSNVDQDSFADPARNGRWAIYSSGARAEAIPL